MTNIVVYGFELKKIIFGNNNILLIHSLLNESGI